MGDGPDREYYFTRLGLEMFPPEGLHQIAGLLSLSRGYDFPRPADLFLDLVGFRLHADAPPLVSDLREMVNRLDYESIQALGLALDEFGRRRHDAMPYIEAWVSAEDQAGEV